MKKLVIMLALFGMFSFSVSAQVSGSNDQEAVRMEAGDAMPDADEVAQKAAALDENITREVCSKSGTVSYYKKSVCEKSGKVSISQVRWNNDAKKFENVKANSAPKSAAKAASSCGSKSKASCGSKSKASCGSKAKSKGCCSGSKAKSCGDKKKS